MNSTHFNSPPMGLRSGLSEDSFRKFEPIIAKAAGLYPTPYQPPILNGYAPTTYAARLRDALRSYRLNNWPCDWDTTNVSKLQVIFRGDVVSFGKEIKKPQPLTTATQLTPLNLTYSELRAFCVLISAGHVNGPILFKDRHNDELFEQFPELENNFNVSIVQPEGETFYVLT